MPSFVTYAARGSMKRSAPRSERFSQEHGNTGGYGTGERRDAKRTRGAYAYPGRERIDRNEIDARVHALATASQQLGENVYADV